MNETAGPTDTLPTSRTLLRTTLIAAAVACVLVVGAVLPAEYGVDPTGVGRMLGLTQMGKLKLVLMQEEADLQRAATAAAVNSTVANAAGDSANAPVHRDSITVTIAPQEGIEVKLAMTKDQLASYSWSADSGAILFDLHGEGPASAGRPSQSYGQGVLRRADGDIVAAFDGNHGWFWRNPTSHKITVTVKAWGDFAELKKM